MSYENYRSAVINRRRTSSRFNRQIEDARKEGNLEKLWNLVKKVASETWGVVKSEGIRVACCSLFGVFC